MPTKKKRLVVASVSGLVALVLADLAASFLTRDGWFLGVRVPPFGLQTTAERRAELERRLDQLESDPRPATRGGFHERYGWLNRPGVYRVDGVEQHINSIGARGAHEFDPAPPEGVLRVACFGESFTFGSEVLDGDDWPTQLGEESDELEVINLGNPGWGTDQALLLWRAKGESLDADVVFIGLLLENIRRNVNRYRAFAYPETEPPIVKPRFRMLAGELVLVALPYSTRREMLEAALSGELRQIVGLDDWWSGSDPSPAWSGLARAYAAVAHERRREPARLWSDAEGEPYLVTLALLETFHREAMESGAQAAPVLVFPDEQDLERARDGRAYWGGLLDELEGRGIPAIDLSVPLVRHPDPDALYLEVHLSPAGNRVVAEYLGQWLSERFR